MIGRGARSFALPVALALVPASAGTSAGPSPVALTATPARVVLAGSGRTNVRVRNSGTKAVVVDAFRAGFALGLRGRPRIKWGRSTRSAAGWLTLRPTHFTIGPHSSVSLAVTAKVPRGAEPGDHDALALLGTRPISTGRVGVRLRLGVVVVVRAPGPIVRHLDVGALHVARRRPATLLELVVANRGNVTESLRGARGVLSKPSGRPVAGVSAANRDLRPRTLGILAFRYRRRLHGRLTAHVVIPADGGRRRLERTYRIRL